ncbi:hypothetical protein BC831DRAFT_437593 [Entophlyctis helioformis]|nr:hypothetical protein BC831DRAFT_437593 [Entophlyctis helioformis]
MSSSSAPNQAPGPGPSQAPATAPSKARPKSLAKGKAAAAARPSSPVQASQPTRATPNNSNNNSYNTNNNLQDNNADDDLDDPSEAAPLLPPAQTPALASVPAHRRFRRYADNTNPNADPEQPGASSPSSSPFWAAIRSLFRRASPSSPSSSSSPLPSTPVPFPDSAASPWDSLSEGKRRTIKWLLVGAASFLAVATAVVLPTLYFAYIPARIERSLNSGPSLIDRIHIFPLDAIPLSSSSPSSSGPDHASSDTLDTSDTLDALDTLAALSSQQQQQQQPPRQPPSRDIQVPGIWANISLTIPLDDVSPLAVTMSSAPLSVWAIFPSLAPDSLLRRLPLARLSLPTIAIPRNTRSVALTYTTQVWDLNLGLIADTLRNILRFGVDGPLAVDVQTEALPRFHIARFGAWDVPMNRIVSLLPFTGPPFNTSALNATLVDSKVDIIPQPSGRLQYKIFATCAFDNPTPITVSPQRLELIAGVYHGAVHLLDVTLPADSVRLGPGRNTAWRVQALSDPDHTDKLMDLVGEVAEGRNVTVTIRDVRARFVAINETAAAAAARRGRMEWLTDLLRLIEFDYTVVGEEAVRAGQLTGGTLFHPPTAQHAMQWFFNFVAKDKVRSYTVIVSVLPVALYTTYMLYERNILGKKQRTLADYEAMAPPAASAPTHPNMLPRSSA